MWLNNFGHIISDIFQISIELPVPENIEESGLNERQGRAVEYIIKYGKITSKDYQKLCPDVSRETLRKDLNGLIEKKIIVKRGLKRGVFYEF